MQTFKYAAISKDGARVTGVVRAFDEYAAVTQIKETCAVVSKITPVKERPQTRGELFGARVREASLAVMCSQFAIILGSGLPVVRAVELIAEQTNDRRLKQMLRHTAADVEAGSTLAHSFESRGRFLPTAFIESVRSGEESGTLDATFRRLQTYYDKSNKLKGKVRAAMTYPMFTVVVAIAVVAVIMVKAVPTFISSFQSMGVDLPAPTRILIAVSNFCTSYWLPVLAVCAVTGIAWTLWGRTEAGMQFQHRRRLRLPVLGKLNAMRAASQLASTLSMLLAAGVPVVRAVSVTAQVLENGFMGRQLSLQAPKMEEGRPLAVCLHSCPFLPELLVEMVAVGEETGTLETTLQVAADYYDNETELRAQKALSLLEPVVVCLLAVVVVFILLAVYLPMFSLYGSYI